MATATEPRPTYRLQATAPEAADDPAPAEET
jgi:hypothetical protein